MDTSGSPVQSQDRELTAVVSDENNNDMTAGKEDSEPDRESDVSKSTTTAEADVCENVNVREMRKFFIEQGRRFAVPVVCWDQPLSMEFHPFRDQPHYVVHKIDI